MGIHSVIFDLDGTLADTLEDIADAANHVLADRGLPTHGLDAYRHFVGEGVRRLMQHATPEEAQGRLDELVEAFRARYLPHMLDRTRPYPGVVRLLEELTRRGVRFAVLSNKPHDATEKVVGALFPGVGFVAVEGHRPEVPKKPDPQSALALTERLGSRPDHVAFVGDTRTDMQTARDAGMVAVGVLWGFRDEEELRANGAKHVIARPDQLLELLS